MKIYLVGGAVRDQLLGIPVKERDYVVVGATISEMQALGFLQVGKEFPVFLHPKTKDEYALARTERKTSPGYKGFNVDSSKNVCLEDDLKRRDLTINAMAIDEETQQLVDPFHGQADLAQKILRHVSGAFIEDPVRILRVARFYARYAHLGFYIADETLALMKKMVASGEVNALVPERVFKEFERALGEKNPENFFEALAWCNALTVLFPEITLDSKGMRSLAASTVFTSDSCIRFAVLCHTLAKPSILLLSKRFRMPNAYQTLALLTAEFHQTALLSKQLSADELLDFFLRLDVFRREDRFKKLLIACEIIAHINDVHFDTRYLLEALKVAKSVNVQELLKQGLSGDQLAKELKKLRQEKIKSWLKNL